VSGKREIPEPYNAEANMIPGSPWHIDPRHSARPIRAGIDLIRSIKIIEAGLQYKRLRIREDTGRARRGLYQQFMYVPPGDIVTDRCARM